MDANGSRYHLLLGLNDWASCLGEASRPLQLDGPPASPVEGQDLAWDDARGELTLRPLLYRFPAAPADRPVALSDRRGAGRDRYGNWYWIGPTGLELLVNSSGTGATTHFWSPGDDETGVTEESLCPFGPVDPPTVPPAPWPLGGLAVTEHHELVVGVLGPAGLLVFDLHAGGPPRRLVWPADVPFRPFDMAPAPGGGVWVLDRDNARLWGLDRHFRVRDLGPGASPPASPPSDLFQPLVGGSLRPAPGWSSLTGVALRGSPPTVADPIAVEALPDGSVLILDQPPAAPFCQVVRLVCGVPAGPPASTSVVRDELDPSDRPGFRLVGHDMAFIPAHDAPDGPVGDRLHVVSSEGNQAFAFDYRLGGGRVALAPVAAYQPLRLFGGKAIVATGDGGLAYDFADRWVPLVEQRRPRYVTTALIETPGPDGGTRPAFDGRTPGCVWHRLMIDACIPPGTSVTVSSRAADDLAALALAPFTAEPPLYHRGGGSELPFVAAPPGRRATWELLFQVARGRYLQLRIGLAGDGRATPRLHALRAWYPRFSYLDHYLPATYRADAASASFLDRFLANLEGFLTAVEDRIDVARLLFDVRSAPAEALDWLAGWYDVALDPSWDEPRRRLFLAHAMDFFQYRGTVRGLTLALRLALDPCADATIFDAPVDAPGPVRIVEGYRRRSAPGAVLGDPTDLAPSVTTRPDRWTPAQGRAALDGLYAASGGPSCPSSPGTYPIRPPCDPAAADSWRRVSQALLGFVPAVTSADAPRWRDFLARRYKTVEALNTVYAGVAPARFAAFDDVPLPTALPAGGAPLADWYAFETLVLPVLRWAHRFTVLIPAPPSGDFAEHQRRLDLVTRVVALEKPAHTVFEVKFYWAMFRVGEARLGKDTVLDVGGRSSQALRPSTLGRDFLAESYPAPRPPQSATDRTVLGRNRLAAAGLSEVGRTSHV